MFPLTYQLTQVLSLLLAGLAALKRQVSGDLAARFSDRILDPAFLLPIAQESFIIDIDSLTVEKALPNRTDLAVRTQHEFDWHYGFAPWPAHNEYLDPVGTTVSTCTDVSTFLQTTDLELYHGFTPWPGYKEYLPPEPAIDNILDETPSPCVPQPSKSTPVHFVNNNMVLHGGLVESLRDEYPSASELCTVAAVCMLCLFTLKLIVVFTHTAEIPSPTADIVTVVRALSEKSYLVFRVAISYLLKVLGHIVTVVFALSVQSYLVSQVAILYLLARRRILAGKLRSGLVRLARLSLLLILRAVIYYIEVIRTPTSVPAPHAVNIRRWRLKRTKCGSAKKKGARKARAAAAAADASAPIPVVAAAQEQVAQPVAPVAANNTVERVPAGFVTATKTIAPKKFVVRRANISGPRLFK